MKILFENENWSQSKIHVPIEKIGVRRKTLKYTLTNEELSNPESSRPLACRQKQRPPTRDSRSEICFCSERNGTGSPAQTVAKRLNGNKIKRCPKGPQNEKQILWKLR